MPISLIRKSSPKECQVTQLIKTGSKGRSWPDPQATRPQTSHLLNGVAVLICLTA